MKGTIFKMTVGFTSLANLSMIRSSPFEEIESRAHISTANHEENREKEYFLIISDDNTQPLNREKREMTRLH